MEDQPNSDRLARWFGSESSWIGDATFRHAGLIVLAMFLLYIASPFFILAPIEYLGVDLVHTPMGQVLRCFYYPIRMYLENEMPGSAQYKAALEAMGVH